MLSKADRKMIKDKLADIVGPDWVHDEECVLEVYSREIEGTQHRVGIGNYPKPDYVVLPKTKDEIKKILKLANEHLIPVTPASAYTSTYNDALPRFGGILLDLKRMKGYEIDEATMHCSVEPGVTLGEFWAALTPKGYQISWPSCPPNTSVMGMYSQRGTGFSCNDIGYLSENVVGMEIILPNGTEVTTGSGAMPGLGQFCRYTWGPDFTGLFLGSQGTLGVITKISMLMFHIPEAFATVRAGYPSLAASFNTIRRFGQVDVGDKCVALDWYQNEELIHRDSPREKPADEPDVILMIKFSGTKERVEADRKTVERIIKEEGGQLIQSEKITDFLDYKGVEPVNGFYQPYGPQSGPERWWKKPGGNRTLIHPIIRPDKALEYAEKGTQIYNKYKSSGVQFSTALSVYKRGRIFMVPLHCFCNSTNPEQVKVAEQLIQEWFDLSLECGGTYYRPVVKQANQVMPMLGTYFELYKQIKKMLDPNGIMNPGKLSYYPETTTGGQVSPG